MAPLPVRLRCKMALALLLAAACAPFSEKILRRHSAYLAGYIALLDVAAADRAAKEQTPWWASLGTPWANDDAAEQMEYIGEIQSTDELPTYWVHFGSRSHH